MLYPEAKLIPRARLVEEVDPMSPLGCWGPGVQPSVSQPNVLATETDLGKTNYFIKR